MKIIFIGTVEFSKRALQKLIQLNAQIAGVCCKEKSKFNSDYVDLRPLCEQNNIPFKYVDDINSKENFDWIKSFNPDIIFCFGWSHILKNKILKLAPMGVLGFHPTKLPKNRGRHPLTWALALDLKKSASTFFFMKEGLDNGEILSQKDFNILNTDDAQILYEKLINIALLQIEEFLPHLKTKTYKTVKQNDLESNIWRKRDDADRKIDFRMSSKAIYNLVRALTKPYIGSFLIYKEKKIIIWKVKMIKNNQNHIESGKVLDINENKIIVKTYDGAIEILHHEFEELPNIGEYF